MSDSKCKTCRAAGEKLFLKGEKCFTPKCTFVRKPYAPGKLQKERKHRSTLTDYGRQLREKQKVRNMYGLREKQFAHYVEDARSRDDAAPADVLFDHLERRLDNVAYKLGFGSSRALARQMVSHGHVIVNGRKMTIPSYQVSVGDVVAIREESKKTKLVEGLMQTIAKHETPAWLSLDAKQLSGKVVATPVREEIGLDFPTVIELYARS